MKRRQEQLSLALVSSTVEQQYRVGAHERFENPLLGLPGPQVFGVAGENLLDGCRVAEKYHRRKADHANGEGVAIGLGTLPHEWDGPEDPIVRLQEARDFRSRRQLDHTTSLSCISYPWSNPVSFSMLAGTTPWAAEGDRHHGRQKGTVTFSFF